MVRERRAGKEREGDIKTGSSSQGGKQIQFLSTFSQFNLKIQLKSQVIFFFFTVEFVKNSNLLLIVCVSKY